VGANGWKLSSVTRSCCLLSVWVKRVESDEVWQSCFLTGMNRGFLINSALDDGFSSRH